jgi:hypothetical protein
MVFLYNFNKILTAEDAEQAANVQNCAIALLTIGFVIISLESLPIEPPPIMLAIPVTKAFYNPQQIH